MSIFSRKAFDVKEKKKGIVKLTIPFSAENV